MDLVSSMTPSERHTRDGAYGIGDIRSLSAEARLLNAVDRLFASWYPRLVRAISRRTGNHDDAEDAAQEAFVRLLDANPRNPRAWLYTVASNVARDRARRRSRQASLMQAHALDGSAADPDAELMRAERRRAVRVVLGMLPPRDQHLLLLHHGGASYREIAQALGVAPGSVGSLLTRAHRRFLLCYESRHETQDESAHA
ncbi:MAG TPA: sigma-70 family RNA polymerase sigma factor [Gemmatimonadales bacterium]|nr:sigma-70 family RNA polymerase sigma factor [Gemmatimonadales bacterium]